MTATAVDHQTTCSSSRPRPCTSSWKPALPSIFVVLSLLFTTEDQTNGLISAFQFQPFRSSFSTTTKSNDVMVMMSSSSSSSSSLPPPSSSQHNTKPNSISQSSSVKIFKNDNDNNSNKKNTRKRRKPKKKKNNDTSSSSSSSSSSPTTSIETWRIYGIQVHPDDLIVSSEAEEEESQQSSSSDSADSVLYPPIPAAVKTSLRKKFGLYDVPNGAIVRRRSLDTRLRVLRPKRSSITPSSSSSSLSSSSDHYPVYNYIVDIPISKRQRVELKWKHRPGQIELLSDSETRTDSLSDPIEPKEAANKAAPYDDDEVDHTSVSMSSLARTMLRKAIQNIQDSSDQPHKHQHKKVVIVGMGPAGLFCALHLALFSKGQIKPILLDRGQPVEIRGRDIGALIHRLNLNKESNFCFGEGGAGTWSDGKLTTRIGRNSNAVRWVLELLVEFGAPPEILWQGAPHLGTDNLVRLLRNMRQALFDLGGEIHFGTKMTDLEFDDLTGQVKAILAEEERTSSDTDQQSPIQRHRFEADAFVLATGHSARDVYERLHESGVKLEAKGFALGFRVEHPQALINQIQLGDEWGPCVTTGKSPTDKANEEFFGSVGEHPSKMPPPSYRLATDQADDGTGGDRHHRGVYSFCMCPGGQIVPASTEPDEICVNGMSFSRRDSVWANSALVVSVAPDDVVLKDYTERYGVMAGIEFQRDMERRAACLGGGNFTVPVQRLTDFVDGVVSETIPASSYRLGVKSAPCHEIYPEPITTALRDALQNHFAHQMPSYYSKEGLLHAVETRTSSPLRVSRDPLTYTAVGTSNLFPAGEGAGFAGGIVSAAVDGLHVAEALLDLYVGDDHETVLEKSKSKGIGYSY